MASKIKSLLPILLIIFVIGGGVFFLAKKNSTPIEVGPATSYEYYWGSGCPHCIEVAKFFDIWEGKDKVSIDKKEVWNDQRNFKIMQIRAESCGIDKNNLGMPMLYTPDGRCYVGDEPIINFFKSLTF